MQVFYLALTFSACSFVGARIKSLGLTLPIVIVLDMALVSSLLVFRDRLSAELEVSCLFCFGL